VLDTAEPAGCRDKAEDRQPPNPSDGCPAPDTDGDGISDGTDECKFVKGQASARGCPDRDGDGVKDSDDICKAKIGIALYRGCPNDDADGDGFKNDRDQCPEQAEDFDDPKYDTDGCPE